MSSREVYDLLRHAIENKLQVVCDYSGHRREMCPHVLGRKNGRQRILGYQFAGGSGSGLPPDGEWRCMVINSMSNVQVREGEWHTGSNHTRPQTCVEEIDAEVAY